MTTQGRINPETLGAFLEGLPDLLESLRAEGYGLGTRQHVAAHELIGALLARRGLPPTLLELDAWLAPLICNTPAQQEGFRDRYLQWLTERRLVDEEDLPPDPPPVKPPPLPPPPPEPSAWERIARRVSAHKRPLIISGAALVAAALFVAYFVGAAYWKGEDLARLVVLNPPAPEPTPVPTPYDDADGDAVILPPPPEPTTGMAWDVEVFKATPTPTPPTPPIPEPGFWVRNFPALVALTLATPFAGLGLWRFLRRRRRERDAERMRGERPRYDKIKVRGARERVFQSAALRPVARGLRHYLSVESRQLDALSTVRATVGRGGLFTPVYGKRRTLPEYLVLIDRVGFGDQLAQFHSDIVARLGERDVYLDTYYFHGDPRRCREGGPDSPQLSLSDLAARHPDHYLLIFSDGTGLLSTTTGRPEPFVEQLLFWRGRALLTPVPRLEWEYREWALEREGLRVLPASLDGLRLLAEALNTDARSVREPGFDESPPYPDILREQPALWKERDGPPPRQTRRLVTHLRRYLGPEGFELLCACAVYPIMQWGVTLFLAYELLPRGRVDALLPRLLRLPWFRHGTMPPWLRRVLVGELPRARRRLVRERLEHLLLAFLEEPERGLRPRFAEEHAPQPSLLARIGERLEALRRRRLLRRRLEPAPARSPLAEPVFLNFITHNSLAEALPQPVRDRLFRRGVYDFGLRLAPAAAFVAAVALMGLFLLLLARPVYDIYTPGAPPDLWSRMLAPTPEPGHSTDPDFFYTPTAVKQGQTVDVTVSVVTPGEYDLTGMRFAPADPSGKISLQTINAGRGVSYSAVNTNRDSLTATFNVAPDAPPGPTELLLYEGDRPRARLPFNVTAADQQQQQQQCPNVRLSYEYFAGGGDGRGGSFARIAVVSPEPAPSLSYNWSLVGRDLGLVTGQGMRSVVVGNDDPNADYRQAVTVTVGGLPAGCPNTATHVFPRGTGEPLPPGPRLVVTAEPDRLTVCPNDPKLNNPQNSIVKVSASLTPVDLSAEYTVSISGGKIINQGFTRANAPTYAWDLSGVAPGRYEISVVSTRADGSGRTGSAKYVTVSGCPARTALLQISFEDGDGDKVNLYAVDMTVRLVPRGTPPEGFNAARFVQTFRRSAAQAQNFEVVFDKVPFGEYEVVVNSQMFEDGRFPVSVGRESVELFGLQLKAR